MNFLPTLILRSACLLLILLSTTPAWAQTRFTVAILSDGEDSQLVQIRETLIDELEELTEGEFDLTFKLFDSGWTIEGIEQAFNQAYSDRSVDLVLVTGFAANQVGVARKTYRKPTFLPLVIDAELLGAPQDGNRSGIRNLSYVSDRVNFVEHLQSFRRLVPYQQAVVLTDNIVMSAIPGAVEGIIQETEALGVTVSLLGHDGVNPNLAERLPTGTDAVIFGGLPRMDDVQMQTLIEAVNAKNLPSFSLLGAESVEKGVLATDARATDWRRLARRNALNMQAVMLGERAEDQPVQFEGKRQMTINMATARQIGLFPRFDVLTEAVLLNEEPEPEGEELTMSSVARLALTRNRDLAAEVLGVSAGQENVALARSNWLPQVEAGASNTRRKNSPLVAAGQFAERSTDAQVSLSQVIYSDDVAAGITIQSALQDGREAGLRASELDTVRESVIAYLNLLQAETQVRVQQDNLNLTQSNLELARDRVGLGSASAADVYRWQSRDASDRSALLNAQAQMFQAREALNRLLNQPAESTFRLRIAELHDPFLFTRAEFDELINNYRALSRFFDYQVGKGISLAPEIDQIDQQIAAKEREVTNLRRDFWLPDFSISSSASSNLDQDPAGGLTDGVNDWNIMLNARLPLFSGGARRADQRRASYELEQLRVTRESIAEKITQQVRSALHAAGASYANIDLSRAAADAARSNLELVTDSYAQGAVSIIELLDAQNASLQAEEGAANAVFAFLIDIITMQRAVGQYDFLLSEAAAANEVEQLKSYITAAQ